MTLKFSYQNEIHRCSDLPSSLAGLHSVLTDTFKTELPWNYRLTYSLPDQGLDSRISVNTQADYEALLNIKSSKPIKVFIEAYDDVPASGNGSSIDYDIIQNKIRTASDDQKELYPKLDSVVEQASEALVPEVKKHSYFDHNSNQEEQIKNIVRETLREQLPYIVSLVKEAVLKELREPIRQVAVPPRNQPQGIFAEERKVQAEPVPSNYAAVEHLDREPVVYQGQEPVQQRELLPSKVEANPVLDQVKSVGINIKDKLAGFAGKAKDMIDDWSQKIEGDPYVTVEEGKYPQSVINKANALKDIFPEEDRKALREFVNQYPKYATLEQLANAFLAKDQPPEAADIADRE